MYEKVHFLCLQCMYQVDWLNSRGFDFPRECGKNDPFPAGYAGKDSSVKVPNFMAKDFGGFHEYNRLYLEKV